MVSSSNLSFVIIPTFSSHAHDPSHEPHHVIALTLGVITLVVGGLLEFKSFEMSKKDNYKPGDYGFDPLGLYALRASFGLDQVHQ